MHKPIESHGNICVISTETRVMFTDDISTQHLPRISTIYEDWRMYLSNIYRDGKIYLRNIYKTGKYI